MITKFDILSSINTNDFLIGYLNDKIKVCNEKIESIIIANDKAGIKYIDNRTTLFLSWKDCLSYYKMQLKFIEDKIETERVSALTVDQKIFYYKETKWVITFRVIHDTIETVCQWINPLFPNINPNRYFEYLFREMDFNKIDKKATKAENLTYCYAIYYGLEQIFKADINKAILNYQNNISKLSKEQIQETQIKLIELIGNLKRQSRTNEAGISFTQRYNRLYKSIEVKEKLFHIDYQILISHFNETITNDLLSSFEIINETIKEITPLLKALPSQQAETKKLTAPLLGLFCGLINKIGIDKREEAESATIYCRRICFKYKLPYTERVRQNYYVNENKKLIQELTERVLPLIDIQTKMLIKKYLDSKYPPKQNLNV